MDALEGLINHQSDRYKKGYKFGKTRGGTAGGVAGAVVGGGASQLLAVDDIARATGHPLSEINGIPTVGAPAYGAAQIATAGGNAIEGILDGRSAKNITGELAQSISAVDGVSKENAMKAVKEVYKALPSGQTVQKAGSNVYNNYLKNLF